MGDGRLMRVAALVLVVTGGAFAAAVASAHDDPPPTAVTVTETVKDARADRSTRYWRRKWLQAERNSDVRGRTIRRLQGSLRRVRFRAPWPWSAIVSCESGGRWDYNGPSGFDGAPQFHPGTWAAYRLPGYPPFAYQASPFQQLVVAELVRVRQGWGAWPACSRKVGLR